MKKFFLSALMLAGLACGCQKLPEAPAAADEMDCLVCLNPVGEISTSESPLTRAGSGNDIYAVQVYKKNGSSEDRFACGFFDDPSEMRLWLKTGSTYNIRIAMVRNAKLLISWYSMANNGIDAGAAGSYEFYHCSNGYYYTPLNRFYYNSNSIYYYYSDANGTTLNSRSRSGCYLDSIRYGYLNDVRYPTCDDWFYAEVNNYAPNGEWENLDVALKRTGFGLRYTLEGVTDGEVTVTIYNSDRTFVQNTTTTANYESSSQFIAYYDTYSAWQYADNYAENVSVSVVWKRGIGITQDLGTKTVQVRRNRMNIVKISLGSDDRNAGVSLTTEAESSMGAAGNLIPVE
jgi:hypothetical protein